jgi:hypothetical protein
MILMTTTGPHDRQAMLDSLDVDAAEFRDGALKERVTVRNPNGGVRTEVREILTQAPSWLLQEPLQRVVG